MKIEDQVVNVLHTDNAANKRKKSPQVSIGMPVYNGGPFLREALDSLLAQTFTDFELIISDNASTDSTKTICCEYAAKDARICYVRQPKNQGATANFQFVLDKSIGEYFMWAASDDIRSETYLELNIKFLRENPNFVASTSPTRFLDRDYDSNSMGDFTIDDDDPNDRIFNFFNGWHANGRFYSLIRRDALIRFPFKREDYLGGDWIWVIFLLHIGKMKNLDKGWLILGQNGVSNKSNVFLKYNTSLLAFIFPFKKLIANTMRIGHCMPLPLKIRLFLKLLILNFYALKLNMIWGINGNRRKFS